MTLRKLEAEESLLATERIAVGSGVGDRSYRRDVVARWSALAAPGARRSVTATPAMLGAIGIGMDGDGH